jgi:hypothetical protein
MLPCTLTIVGWELTAAAFPRSGTPGKAPLGYSLFERTGALHRLTSA